MKKIVFLFTLLLFTVNLFSQSPSRPTLSKDYYLQKSKKQKTTGLILLGTGAAIAVSGGLYKEKSSAYFDFTGAILGAVGGVVVLSSIPFFISSAKNARRAALISFNYQKLILPQQDVFALKKQPALTLKIQL